MRSVRSLRAENRSATVGLPTRLRQTDLARSMDDSSALDAELVRALVQRLHQLYGSTPRDLERMCWMVVHEHHHGVMPTEYDIREVNEDLYLAVLSDARSGTSLVDGTAGS